MLVSFVNDLHPLQTVRHNVIGTIDDANKKLWWGGVFCYRDRGDGFLCILLFQVFLSGVSVYAFSSYTCLEDENETVRAFLFSCKFWIGLHLD